MTENVSYIDYHTDYTTVAKSLFLERKIGLVENLRNEFPRIWELYKQLKSLDWDENEIDISSCRNEFLELPTEVSQLMIKTLAWQFEADSSAAHIAPLMTPFVTGTEMMCYLNQLTGNECLTPDHEVLTPTGWKSIADVTKEDKVAQWNYDTRVITFTHPQAIIKREHSGTMYHIHSLEGGVDQLVTPNHRLPIQYNRGSNRADKWLTAEAISFDNTSYLPTSGRLGGNTRTMTAIEKLYIAIKTEGVFTEGIRTTGRGGKGFYVFNLKDSAKVDRLLQLCEMAGCACIVEVPPDQTVTNYLLPQDCLTTSIVQVYLEDKDVRSDIYTYGWLELDKIGREMAAQVLGELFIWNSSVRYSIGPSDSFADKETLDLVSALAHLTDYSLCKTTAHKDSEGNERYRIYITPNDSVKGDEITKTQLQYKGNVHCLTVPDSYFLVKRNNHVSVTGNCLHALAYKVIVESSFDNPEEFLKELLSIKESFQRLDTVKRVFDETHVVAHRYALGLEKDLHLVRKTIFKFWVTALALERIQFMSSFAITFGLAEQGYFVPIAKLVQKICTDEFQVHVQADKAILSNEMAIESNFSAYLDSIEDIQAIVKEVVDSEVTWLEFLFEGKDEIARIRKDRVKDFVYYSASEVYKFLKIDNPYSDIKDNPLAYMNNWIIIDSNQSSPQEESVANYLLGGFVDDSADLDNSFEFEF